MIELKANDYCPGAEVKLASGSPTMTVTSRFINNDCKWFCKCSWFVGDEYKEETFPIESLKIISTGLFSVR